MILTILFTIFFLWIMSIVLLYLCIRVKYPNYNQFVHDYLYSLKEDHILSLLLVGSPLFVIVFLILLVVLIFSKIVRSDNGQ